MANQSFVPADILARYEVHEWRNGLAILSAAHSHEWTGILEVLRGFSFTRSEVMTPGGSKGLMAGKLDSHFTRLGWIEKKFDTKIVVDDAEHVTPTHKIDCYKNRVALEVEWNNKDPFFDRDLNNFRLLFDLRAIDVGVIITRCSELQQIFNKLGRGPSFGKLHNAHGETPPAPRRGKRRRMRLRNQRAMLCRRLANPMLRGTWCASREGGAFRPF